RGAGAPGGAAARGSPAAPAVPASAHAPADASSVTSAKSGTRRATKTLITESHTVASAAAQGTRLMPIVFAVVPAMIDVASQSAANERLACCQSGRHSVISRPTPTVEARNLHS